MIIVAKANRDRAFELRFEALFLVFHSRLKQFSHAPIIADETRHHTAFDVFWQRAFMV